MEISILHHFAIILFLLWLLSFYNWFHPVFYPISLIYLYLVQERYVLRLRRKLRFEERRHSNQRRVLCDSETVRWLNYAVEKIWPICMEQIASQKILLPIIPWFLNKYKPWTAKEAQVQHLYLGRSPPMFTEMRVLRESSEDDHLVLELGMNFLTADDMSAILAVKLRKRLGFGMWAKLHLTGMHVEGKVLIGVKFLRKWPFLGRLRVCFAEPPYFQMTVKPMFTHGLDVTELPGIAGWLDKLLSVAFEETLVEPNMLVVDMEKFVSPQQETWFSVHVKEPIAYAKVEVLEASDMKPSDLNGLADPYLKGQLGPYRFKTKIQKKTLAPKWQEEFRIPICSWEAPNVLSIEVRDKDHFVDDCLGDCTINISDLRDGQRHDMWIALENIKMGRLHLAITVEENIKGLDIPGDVETFNKEDAPNEDLIDEEDEHNPTANDVARKGSIPDASPVKHDKFVDNFEPINIEGQNETGIWVLQPGNEVSQTWEPRKGKSRRLDTEIQRVPNGSLGSISLACGSLDNDSSGADTSDGKSSVNPVRRGLQKISTFFHRSSKKEDHLGGSTGEAAMHSPYANLKPINTKSGGLNFVVEDSLSVSPNGNVPNVTGSSDGSGQESPGKGKVKGMAKSILKNAEKHLKHVVSRKGSNKGSKKSRGGSSLGIEQEICNVSVSSEDEREDESLSCSGVDSNPVGFDSNEDDHCNNKKQTVPTDSDDCKMHMESQTKKVSVDRQEKKDGDGDVQTEVSQPKPSGEDLRGDEVPESGLVENNTAKLFEGC